MVDWRDPGAAVVPAGHPFRPAQPASFRQPQRNGADGAEGAEGQGTPAGEPDLDDDDMENSLSLAAIEAELKPKVMEAFDKIANEYKRLRRLQDQDIANQLQNEFLLSPAQERKYKKIKEDLVAEVKTRCASTRRASTRWWSSSTTSTSASSATRAA